MFGPGDPRFAHTDDEVISIAQTIDVARVYAAWVAYHLGLGKAKDL